jgi:hypothetical protein
MKRKKTRLVSFDGSGPIIQSDDRRKRERQKRKEIDEMISSNPSIAITSEEINFITNFIQGVTDDFWNNQNNLRTEININQEAVKEGIEYINSAINLFNDLNFDFE